MKFAATAAGTELPTTNPKKARRGHGRRGAGGVEEVDHSFGIGGPGGQRLIEPSQVGDCVGRGRDVAGGKTLAVARRADGGRLEKLFH
jgi:hypothetical protein